MSPLFRSGRPSARSVTMWLLTMIAVVFCYFSLDLQLGSPGRPGPGVFPLVTAVMLGLLSVSLLVHPDHNEREDGDASGSGRLRSLVSTAAGLVVFGAAVRLVGLIPAVFLVLLTVTALDPRLRWRQKFTLALAVSLVSWLLFIVLLSMPVRPFAVLG